MFAHTHHPVADDDARDTHRLLGLAIAVVSLAFIIVLTLDVKLLGM
jgi:hypothetical protein